jgi:hypothetical protein
METEMSIHCATSRPLVIALFAALLLAETGPARGAGIASQDRLLSWNDGLAKKGLIDFVRRGLARALDEALRGGWLVAGAT